ncbi:MAG: hypothetical protein R2762_13485 [Bryobacteraceae bacterium]
MKASIPRRAALASLAAAAVPASTNAQTQSAYWALNQKRIDQHADAAQRLLDRQTVSKGSRWLGGLPDGDGLHHGGSTTGLVIHYTAALLQPKSRFHGSAEVMDRLKLALGFLDRKTTADGNLELLTTNFNSPPDTSFAMYNLAGAVTLARAAGSREIEALIKPLVERHAAGLVKGGVHTPNHRWVMCSALALVNTIYPDPALVRRIDQWLSEGIDIDADGMYSERSTGGYNGIVNRALCVIARHRNRRELLDPVRRNLDAMLRLLHPGNEPVTEVSRRQDLNTRGTISGYWFALRSMALTDGNGVYETLARQFEPGMVELMIYPDLQKPGPEPAAVPDNYEHVFPGMRVGRIRRGSTSATILMEGNGRIFTLRSGEAIVGAVRVASAFFGKGQFVPTSGDKEGSTYRMEQSLDAGYYQPIGETQPWGVDEWYRMRHQRRRTEVCTQKRVAEITETSGGFRLRIRVDGTADVPVAVEISLDGEGKLTGAKPAGKPDKAWLLADGATATWTAGGHSISFGPGRAETTYTQVRGAEPMLNGNSVYLTGYTPFDHTIEFRCR